MNLPKVTVMIPTYNQEEYIAEAIESALAQDYPNLEVVVTDDCSTDRTGEIAKSYEKDHPNFHYILNEHNLGRVGNYHNTLYQHAKGDWVVNLDGDDYYRDNHYISRVMERVIAHPDVVCYFAKRYISQKLKKFKDKEIAKDCYIFDGKQYFIDFFEYGGFAHAGAFYKRELTFDDKLCYTYPGIQSDFHGIIRFCPRGKVILGQDDGYYWRVHGCNQTTSVSNKRKYISERECQYSVIRDIPNSHLTEEQKEMWLESGRQWARKQYLSDCLTFTPSWRFVGAAIRNYNFSLSEAIIIAKAILRICGLRK